MTITYSPEENKKRNHFTEGITRIKNMNNNYFLNVRSNNSIYDVSDITSYFMIEPSESGCTIRFRQNTRLPEAIRQDIEKLFYSIWPVAEK